MTNLLSTATYRSIVMKMLGHLAHRRNGERLRRSFFIGSQAFRGQYDGNGGLSHVVDDMNSAHDDEIIDCYRYASRYGQVDQSFADELFYVDPATGSDVTGDGTQNAPWASLEFLPYVLPRRIDHAYTVIIASDLSAPDYSLDLCGLNFGPNGSLSIIGRGAPTVIDGPLTAGAPVYYNAILAIPHGGVHAPDEHIGRWVRFLSGDAAGEAYPIWYNTASTIYIPPWCYAGGTYTIDAADTFEIIEPSVSLALEHIAIEANSRDLEIIHDTDFSWGSHVGFFNLDIDLSVASDRTPSFQAKNSNIMMSFVRMNIAEGNKEDYALVQLHDCIFNFPSVFNTALAVLADCNIENLNDYYNPFWASDICAGLTVVRNEGQSPSTYSFVEVKNGWTQGLCTRNQLAAIGVNYLWLSMVGSIWGAHSSVDTLGVCTASAIAYASITAIESRISLYNHTSVFIGSGNFLMHCSPSSQNSLYINGYDLDTTAGVWAQYGLWVQSITHVTEEGALGALTGAVGQILFGTTSPPTPGNWPAAQGTTTADLIGSFVTRVLS